jgi:hypothetical protein
MKLLQLQKLKVLPTEAISAVDVFNNLIQVDLHSGSKVLISFVDKMLHA